jgi:hypothetical protein
MSKAYPKEAKAHKMSQLNYFDFGRFLCPCNPKIEGQKIYGPEFV